MQAFIAVYRLTHFLNGAIYVIKDVKNARCIWFNH